LYQLKSQWQNIISDHGHLRLPKKKNPMEPTEQQEQMYVSIILLVPYPHLPYMHPLQHQAPSLPLLKNNTLMKIPKQEWDKTRAKKLSTKHPIKINWIK
jgi:hypothetical protein